MWKIRQITYLGALISDLKVTDVKVTDGRLACLLNTSIAVFDKMITRCQAGTISIIYSRKCGLSCQ